MENLLRFVLKAMALKMVKRAGWNKDKTMNGKRYFCQVKNAESVASHSWLSALIVLLLTKISNREDALDILAMALIHDLPEIITGDPLTPFYSLEEVRKKDLDEAVAFRTIASDLPDDIRIWLTGLLDEFVEQRTERARLVKACEYADPILLSLLYAQDPENIVDPAEFAETNMPKIKQRAPDLAQALSEILEGFDVSGKS